MTLSIYNASDLRAAYHLRYGWTGWASGGALPPLPAGQHFEQLTEKWEEDGLRLLAQNGSGPMLQLTFSVKPQVSPVFFTARVKGRLQYAYRVSGCPVQFSRKVAMRTIGENRRAEVEAYISRQADKEPLVDPRFREFLKQFTISDPIVDLCRPTQTQSGRYWYNLHLVLVVQNRFRIVEQSRLAAIRDAAFEIARRNKCAVSRLSVMPDHLHVAMRGNLDQSPQEIALTLLNDLAGALGRNAVWQHGYYAGTFGEYDMEAVRKVRP